MNNFKEKFISFGMKNCIDRYKSESIKKREFAKTILNNRVDPFIIAEYRSVFDLFDLNIVQLLIFILVGLSTGFVFNIFVEYGAINKGYALIIALVVSLVVSILFKNNQCKYLIDEFKKIDAADALENLKKHEENQKILQEKEMFKKKIAACNLFLK